MLASMALIKETIQDETILEHEPTSASISNIPATKKKRGNESLLFLPNPFFYVMTPNSDQIDTKTIEFRSHAIILCSLRRNSVPVESF